MSARAKDDDILWIEYLKEAEKADDRLVDGWTKVIDVILVFVGLFIGVLTAFIIQTSNNLEPDPAEVTNKILISIYSHTMNSSNPIDLDQFLRLDGASRATSVFQNWLLHISLTLSIMVAVVAMGAKLWVVRYSHEVRGPGLLHERATSRQRTYEGSVEWGLRKYIDTLPLITLIAVVLFGIYIFSSISQRQKYLGFVSFSISHLGIAFFLVATFCGAFLPDTPFRSPFSNFIKLIYSKIRFRVLNENYIPIFGQNIRWFTIFVVFISTLMLAAAGYFLQKGNFVYFPLMYFPMSFTSVLWREGEEKDTRPRWVSLPQFISFETIILSILYVLSVYFSYHSTLWSLLLFGLASLLLLPAGSVSIKMSETKTETRIIEARAISWLLKRSFDKEPGWFERIVECVKESPNARALLLSDLLPILTSLITPLPGQEDDTLKVHTGTPLPIQEDDTLKVHTPLPIQEDDALKVHIRTLAILLDFEPHGRSIRRNEALQERPRLPERLVLELLRRGKCLHEREGEKWPNGQKQCSEGCASDAAEHILQLCQDSEGNISRFRFAV